MIRLNEEMMERRDRAGLCDHIGAPTAGLAETICQTARFRYSPRKMRK